MNSEKIFSWFRYASYSPEGHGGKLQEDSLEEQYRTLLILNVVLNCIAFWNTLAIQQIAEELRKEGYAISQEELSHITPTMKKLILAGILILICCSVFLIIRQNSSRADIAVDVYRKSYPVPFSAPFLYFNCEMTQASTRMSSRTPIYVGW